MQTQQTIKCAFCAGRGTNPFYRGTCPVCKGRGKKEVIAPFVVCNECKGNGKKSGTSLTCFECRGIGVVADIREDIEKARSEIREVQREMTQETRELYGKVNPAKLVDTRYGAGKKASKVTRRKDTSDGDPDVTSGTPRAAGIAFGDARPRWRDRKQLEVEESTQDSRGICFCQSCAKETHQGSAYKVCEKCFFLYKFGEVREIKEKEDPPPLKLRRARENER